MKSHWIYRQAKSKGSFTSYLLGFILSILLTLSAYFLVREQVFSRWVLTLSIVGLGVIQMFIQLLFFLHLGSESKPRWNLLSFLFMTMVVLILVFGSLWIMYNLEERVMPSMHATHQQGM
jgi:cytochrome o ubiquinol oxidase operon protein cyoD